MYFHVTAAKVVRPYVLDLTFADGTRRQVDIEQELYGEMFEPLRDPEQFGQVRVDPELGTVAWPNGADLSPEYLYGWATPESTESQTATTPTRDQQHGLSE